jgi:hypothetical protein
MRRLCSVLATAALAVILSGCGGGEDQPNKPLEAPTVSDGANAGKMMQGANSGMDPKKKNLPPPSAPAGDATK